VPELGGTITVVAAGVRGVLPQAASIALRISKLDTSFMFISSFNRQCQFRRAMSLGRGDSNCAAIGVTNKQPPPLLPEQRNPARQMAFS
jgi:hypothetical protein